MAHVPGTYEELRGNEALHAALVEMAAGGAGFYLDAPADEKGRQRRYVPCVTCPAVLACSDETVVVECSSCAAARRDRALAALDRAISDLPQGLDPYGARLEDLPLAGVAWADALREALADAAKRDERRAVLAELVAGGGLAELAASRRLPNARRGLPRQVAEDLVAYHRLWTARGYSHSIGRAYPEARS